MGQSGRRGSASTNAACTFSRDCSKLEGRLHEPSWGPVGRKQVKTAKEKGFTRAFRMGR